jgi:ribosome-associated protein
MVADDFQEPGDDPEADFGDEGPSKSQLKREMHALRELGERIATMPKGQRDALPLTEPLRRAMAEFDRIRSREARRRHLSFVGKLLRTEDTAPLLEALERLDGASAAASRELHVLEAWRDAILAGDDAVTELLDLRPTLERPQLRQLVRAARREAQAGGDERRRFRELFRFLREAAGDEALPLPGSGPH